MNPSTLQSMFQAVHSGKSGVVYDQAAKLKKKQPMMLHSDPSILGTPYLFISLSDSRTNDSYELVLISESKPHVAQPV